MAAIEDDPIARFQRSFQLNEDSLPVHTRDRAQVNAALFAETRVDQFLVVDAAKPAGGKTARKGHGHFIAWISDFGLQLWQGFGRYFTMRVQRLATIQGLPINSRDVGNIFG